MHWESWDRMQIINCLRPLIYSTNAETSSTSRKFMHFYCRGDILFFSKNSLLTLCTSRQALNIVNKTAYIHRELQIDLLRFATFAKILASVL